MIQVTIKCQNRFIVLDKISRSSLCCEILPLLSERLGSNIPMNARLMENGHLLKMHETFKEVSLMKT